MFTAILSNPAAKYIREFASLEEAERWAFRSINFIRGVSRVEITDENGEVVSWY